MKKNLLILASVLSLSMLTACSSTPKEEPKTAEGLYQQAQEYLKKTSYTKAAETFEKVELEHPYSSLAAKSRLMAAYSYYEDKKYDDAIIALDRFIKYHPGNKDIAYAYYLKAQKVRRLIRQDFINAFEKCDIILTPTSPVTAFPIGDKSMQENPINMWLNDVFTVSVNLAGLPAMSLPMGLSQNGLPLGLQLIGKAFDEGTIFKTASALEQDAAFRKGMK